MSEEFYMRPVLCVRDVRASIAYYCDKLAFEPSWTFPEDEPIIGQVGRNGLDVILDSGSSIPRASTPTVLSMSLHAPEALSALYEELEGRGADVAGPPSEAPWQKGLLQLVVRDLDENVLVFWGEPSE